MIWITGAVVCTATSSPDPVSASLTGTLVLDADRPEVSMPLEFRLDGELAPPSLRVELQTAAYGAGPPDAEADTGPGDIVEWEAGPDRISFHLTDPSWAPVEVTWSVSGLGMAIDAPPDEFGPAPDTTITFPTDDVEEWTVGEAVLRFPRGHPPRVDAAFGRIPPLATTEQTLDPTVGRVTALRPPADCNDPCEMSIWVSYAPRNEPLAYQLFGDVEVAAVNTHTPVEVRALDLVLTLPATLERYAQHEWNVCLEIDDLFIGDPAAQTTTFFEIRETLDGGRTSSTGLQPRSLSDSSCAREIRVVVSDHEVNENDTIRVGASVWALEGREPSAVRLVEIEP